MMVTNGLPKSIGHGVNMEWILVLWLNTPSNYTIHSEYITQKDCFLKEEYYNDIYKKVGTKLQASCVSSKYPKFVKSKNQLFYTTVTIEGFYGR